MTPQLWDGVPRTFEPRPDLIIMNEASASGATRYDTGTTAARPSPCATFALQGTNDGTTNITAAMITVLNDLLAACPGTPIAVLLPFDGAQSANLQASGDASGGGSARLARGILSLPLCVGRRRRQQ